MALLLFDLDGTLVDSTDYLTRAIHLSLEDMRHIEEPSRELIQSAFGLTGGEFWSKVIPQANAQEIIMIRERRRIFLEQLVKGNDILFSGVRETLAALKKAGHTLSTASNCGTRYLDMVLDTQEIRQYFTSPICLGSIAGEKKADILTEHFKTFPKKDVYLIGDRSSDIEAARAHQIPIYICTYGFGHEEEWRAADERIDAIHKLVPMFEN
ncbi:HAD family hydrolase [Jeotgalibacillus campisalis]|uniref:Haloacid dehalogenase n=1 Tax=Jeotgalibacillus campisalis TaxID=220754 RepID=A0A0C2RG39_9BACL|nr:HAD hydrolase-like protein [Jeotgalibacillus campisalis]KIL49150.1 haloacid dehalogenase [Jeotgalibacillus campisalis]